MASFPRPVGSSLRRGRVIIRGLIMTYELQGAFVRLFSATDTWRGELGHDVVALNCIALIYRACSLHAAIPPSIFTNLSEKFSHVSGGKYFVDSRYHAPVFFGTCKGDRSFVESSHVGISVAALF